MPSPNEETLRRLNADSRMQDRIRTAILMLFAGLLGFAISSSLRPNTYAAAKANPDAAAQGLCDAGFNVFEPGVGSHCD